jgi:putative transposase
VRSCGPSPWNVPDGAGDGPLTLLGTPAGGSTTSGSTACGGTKACVFPTRSARSPSGATACGSGPCPIRPNVVWALDFQFNQTADGRTIKLLNVIDEFTREALAIEIKRSIDADAVVACLEKITTERPAPVYLRFDIQGPEFIAHAVADWCRFNDAGTLFIDPSSLWQNAWIESFNGRLRDEHLNGQLFDSLLEAQVLTELWRIDYNSNRRHSELGRQTPAAFAEAWTIRNQLQLA